MNKTAVITGITGQDGAYLAAFLLGKGYRVFGITRDVLKYDDRNLRYLNVQDQVQIIGMTEPARDRILAILEKTRPDEIYNLASQSSVGHSFVDPYTTINYNILSVLHWLEGVKTVNPAIRFYQASSSEMFGNVRSTDLPLKESMVFHPASPYGVSKASAHWLAVNYRESTRLFAACGILFNHESALRGKNFVVKKIISTAVKIALGLYKGKLQLGNLDIQRDWGYAPEYVKAMWLMLQQEKPEDYLICSGNILSLKDLVNQVFRELELDAEQHIEQDQALLRPNELEVIYGDNSKAKTMLHWDYQMTNNELVRQLIADEEKFITWEQKQPAYAAV